MPAPVTTLGNTFIADFNEDGLNDIAAAFSGNSGSINVLQSFGPTQTISAGILHSNTIAADLEGDADTDFASVNGSLTGVLTITRRRGH